MLNDIKSKDKKGLEILNWIMDNQPDCSSLCIIDDITKNIVNIFPEWVVKIEKAKIKSKIIESINTFDIPIHVPTIFDTIYC